MGNSPSAAAAPIAQPVPQVSPSPVAATADVGPHALRKEGMPMNAEDASRQFTEYILSKLSITDPASAGLFGKSVAMLSENPYFSAGAGLYLLTILGRFGTTMTQTTKTLVRRRFRVSMEMTNNDASYDWMMRWLSSQPAFSVQQFSVMVRGNLYAFGNDSHATDRVFGPSPNVNHYFLYRGRLIKLFRSRQSDRAMGGEVLETLELSTFGVSKNIMVDIITDAERNASERDKDKTVVYQNTGSRWTRPDTPRSRRPLSSVVLDGDMSRRIVDDVRTFLDSKEYYRNLGVPYRRGYLLHGPPGCGKSSFAMAMAGEMNLAICTLSLSSHAVNDEVLGNLLNTAPLRSMVLLEDIDRAFSANCQVTMSGLLNALDGVAAQEGRIVFMTTNHVEKLDPALIRPGRVDMKAEVGLITRVQGMKLFSKFFPNATEQQLKNFAAVLPEQSLSVAQVQSHLFLYRNDADAAVEKLPGFLRESQRFEEAIQTRRQKNAKEAAASLARNPPILGM